MASEADTDQLLSLGIELRNPFVTVLADLAGEVRNARDQNHDHQRNEQHQPCVDRPTSPNTSSRTPTSPGSRFDATPTCSARPGGLTDWAAPARAAATTSSGISPGAPCPLDASGPSDAWSSTITLAPRSHPSPSSVQRFHAAGGPTSSDTGDANPAFWDSSWLHEETEVPEASGAPNKERSHGQGRRNVSLHRHVR